MRIPATNCPDCNSLQRFTPNHRIAGDSIETYIVCKMCRTTTVIEIVSREEFLKRRRHMKQRNRMIRRTPSDRIA